MKRNGPKALTALRGLLDLKYHPIEKANAWKMSSHPMSCGTKIMNSGWRLEFKLCSNP
jgi:hypothetical protein